MESTAEHLLSRLGCSSSANPKSGSVPRLISPLCGVWILDIELYVSKRYHTIMQTIRFFLLTLLVAMASCSTPRDLYPAPENAHLLIPLGSTSSPTFSTVVSLDDRPYEYAQIVDGLGNSWASVAISDIGRSAELTIRYTVTKREFTPYPCISDRDISWLEPNYYIDWRDESILSVVRDLRLSELPRPDAVRRIGGYVLNHLTYGSRNKAQPASIYPRFRVPRGGSRSVYQPREAICCPLPGFWDTCSDCKWCSSKS